MKTLQMKITIIKLIGELDFELDSDEMRTALVINLAIH